MSTLPHSYYSYKNALTEFEQIMETNEQFEHLKSIRYYDYLNRMGILNSKPVYGKDLKKAVKVQLPVSNLYQKPVKYGEGNVPSSIFNSIASKSAGKNECVYSGMPAKLNKTH